MKLLGITHTFLDLCLLSVFHKTLFFTSMSTYLQNSFSKQFVFSIKNILQSFRIFRGQINILQIFQVGQKSFVKKISEIGRPVQSTEISIFKSVDRSGRPMSFCVFYQISLAARGRPNFSVGRPKAFFGRPKFPSVNRFLPLVSCDFFKRSFTSFTVLSLVSVWHSL